MQRNKLSIHREQLKEKDYVVRTLLNMKCKSIDNCTSTSCNNLPSAKSPRKNRTEINDTPAGNTPKETIKEPKNEQKQKKVRDKEEKSETISTKPSDTNADVTNRVFIMGDSIVKHIRGYELSQRVENCKVFVKSFSGAKVRCMEDYIQPTLRETPSHVILNVGTSDVTTKQDPQQNAKGIINLAVKIKRNCDVSISSIITRNDKYLRKAVDVNRNLKDRCREKKFRFVNHGTALTIRHLNASKLHLNKRGTQALSNQFAEAISNTINRQSVLHSLANNDSMNSTRDTDGNKAKFKGKQLSGSNLKTIRKGNIKKLIIGQININSLRDKFDCLVQQITGNVDILMVPETKLDNSFPVSQFLIDGYGPPIRLDRDIHRGGLMLFVRDDIPCKLLSLENKPVEGFYVEINLRKTKWLLCCFYNPSRSNIDFHLEHLNRNLALYSSCYENFMIIGDFNVEANNRAMSIFCDTYNLKNLIKEPTCYKNPNKPSCIDLMLTNKPRSFKHSCVIETGLSDFHRMTVTVMKATFEKLQPRVVNYRDYKYFENYRFRAYLLPELSNANIEENGEGLSDFLSTCKSILDLQAPRKQKYARGNHMPFMNRALSKEIMTRTRLETIF